MLPTATGEKNEWPGRFTRPVERVNMRYRELADEFAHVSFIDCGDLFIEVRRNAPLQSACALSPPLRSAWFHLQHALSSCPTRHHYSCAICHIRVILAELDALVSA